MDRVRVASSNVASVGYDPLYYLLEVEFCDGATYRYARVPVHIHQAFMDAASKGTYFRHHIRDRYPTTKMSSGSGRDPACERPAGNTRTRRDA